jgi:hypothetical protein
MTKSTKTTTALAPALSAASLQAGLLVGGGQEALEIAQAIGQQVYRNRLRQTAIAAQAEQAERLANAVTLRTVEHYDAYLRAELALRDQPRDRRVQAEVEAFALQLRSQQANSLAAIRNATLDAIETTAAEAVYAPPPSDREIVITEEPSGLAKFFGARTRTTRISR